MIAGGSYHIDRDMAGVSSLTRAQLKRAATNLHMSGSSPEEIREALREALRDGYKLADFNVWKRPKKNPRRGGLARRLLMRRGHEMKWESAEHAELAELVARAEKRGREYRLMRSRPDAAYVAPVHPETVARDVGNEGNFGSHWRHAIRDAFMRGYKKNPRRGGLARRKATNPLERNPLPIGRYIKVRAIRRKNGRVDLYRA